LPQNIFQDFNQKLTQKPKMLTNFPAFLQHFFLYLLMSCWNWISGLQLHSLMFGTSSWWFMFLHVNRWFQWFSIGGSQQN